ncbi:hypothetical protein L226DRAFT_397867 [Lentinus tigrinus ALCF2SS1-7]|uniref:Uncharacterized protein n=1 Tax=Lentinus tigrinus ALCF2SS1-6 TaxID=1328759 RepID=A0A5C2SD57_9APHY|nr:hypothetical protein L227DRAFT_55410 [Lentinus tigrinus ALCF2SS1-6]RPD76138.1 hypothetical protein L226DRAFT_397867 [Lentinus tigrinus ALCF2SS1-7]
MDCAFTPKLQLPRVGRSKRAGTGGVRCYVEFVRTNVRQMFGWRGYSHTENVILVMPITVRPRIVSLSPESTHAPTPGGFGINTFQQRSRLSNYTKTCGFGFDQPSSRQVAGRHMRVRLAESAGRQGRGRGGQALGTRPLGRHPSALPGGPCSWYCVTWASLPRCRIFVDIHDVVQFNRGYLQRVVELQPPWPRPAGYLRRSSAPRRFILML